MSDFRAVAAMTETLRNILRDAVHDEFPGARVETNRPQKDPPDPRTGLINIYLYLVEHNAQWRNMELPVRAQDGTLLRMPRIALDLHYLVSFYGSDAQQIPQLLLGKTVATLHKMPYPQARYLPREPPPGEPAPVERYLKLWDSGLLAQLHQVSFIPLTLSHDELSKLWTIFFQVPYVLSVAYRCSVILIEPEMDEVPQPSLPSRGVQLRDASMELPTFDEVVPQQIEARPGARIVIKGRNLDGITSVRIGGLEAPVRSTTQSSVLVDLPDGLPAGMTRVEGARDVVMGNPPTPHRLYQTNQVSFTLRPRFTAPPQLDAASRLLTLQVAPPVAAGQPVSLLLNQIDRTTDAPPNAYTLPAAAPAVGATLTAALSGVAAGTYLLRLQVAGTTTALEVDNDPESPTYQQFVAPQLTVPTSAAPANGQAP